MAFPTIPTTGAGRVLTTNQLNTTATRTFPNLSSLTKNSGDLLIAIIVAYQTSTGTDAAFSSWGGGFTEFHDTATGTTLAMGAAYKWSDGTETGTFSVTQAGTITGDASMILLSIPGAHLSTPPEAGSRASGTTGAADPASFNPGGWDSEDTLWISVVGSGMTNASGTWDATGTTAPTNYTSRVDTNASDTSTIGDCEAAVAFRQLAAASADVGTAGVDTSNARNGAFVIAVRPAPEPNDGSATGSIDWVGSATGTTVRSGAASGSIDWAGSATGQATHAGEATGAVTWVGTATGEAPVVVMEGEATGTITWAGTATGVTSRSGEASGAVTWVGAATGTTVHEGDVTGTITWAGVASGETDYKGSASGAITWAGTAHGSAPGVGPQEGTAEGGITWNGEATGLTTRSGIATGAVTWEGVASGVIAASGSAVGAVSWAGVASGPAPARYTRLEPDGRVLDRLDSLATTRNRIEGS